MDLIISQARTGGTVTDPGTGGLNEPEDTNLYYFHLDAIGSVRVVTRADGTLEARYDFTPTGQVFEETAGTSGNRVKFAGKERDAETAPVGSGANGALDYFGARYYQNTTGRFTSVDPISITGDRLTNPRQLNRYAYAANNPLGYVDLFGQEPCQVGSYTTDDCERVTGRAPIPSRARVIQDYVYGRIAGVKEEVAKI